MFYSGDLISTLPGIRQACRRLGATAEIYLWLGKKGQSYEGAQHPYGGEMQNEYTYQMLKPLLEFQNYISLVKPWEGEKIIVDLDDLRQHVVGMPYGSIHRWPFYLWPDMACNLNESWIGVYKELHGVQSYPSMDDVKKRDTHEAHNKIIINRTSRYHNPFASYFFLRDYQEELVFAGMEQEHKEFCTQWDLDIPLLKVADFYELAFALNSCRFFVGNQSLCFAIAEGLKIPRILEACPYAPNVIPVGKDAYDFQRQEAFEFLFKDLKSKL